MARRRRNFVNADVVDDPIAGGQDVVVVVGRALRHGRDVGLE